MAITQEQANQLTAAYNAAQPTGDFSGLQGLVNQYGVTGADVQAFAPGFDVATHAPGVVLADTSDLVNQAYSSIGFTDAADPNYQAGINYWGNQLQSGAITPETFQKEFLTAASSVTDPNYATYVANAQNRLSNLGTPDEFYERTGYGYNDAMQYILANIEDPTKIYQRATEAGVTPEDILAIQQWYNKDTPSAVPTLDAINQYLEQGKTGYEQRFGEILDRTFGTGDDLTNFESLLGDRQISDIFQPDKYSKMSLESIEAELGASDLNKYQSAVDTARYAGYMFGADQDAQQKIVSDIMSGKIDNPLVEKAYKDLLAGNALTSDTQMDLLREAAKANPDAPIFKANPALYAAYSPLGETKEQTAAAGQYGYYNNAPILSASEVDKVLDGKTLTQDFRSGRTDENSMGWDLYSRDAGRIANGVSVFGITDDKDQIKRLDALNKSLADLGQVQKVTGGDSPDYYVAQKVKTDSEGNPYLATETIDSYQYDQYLDQKAKIDNAAAKLGIDASEYDSLTDLYNAVQDASKDLYQITGRTVGWDPAVAEKLGIKTLTADAGDMNHASVLYKKEGDKLLAISDPSVFTANDKRRSGFGAQVAPWAPIIAMATLPFGGVGGALTQGLGALAGTAMPAYMPAIINAAYGTAMGGGDFNDFTRTLITQGATDFMANQFTQGLQSLVKDGTISADFAKDIAKVGAGAIATGAREGDVTGYLKNAGINYAFNEALSNLGSKAGFDTKNMTASEKIILSSLMPAVLRGQMSEKDLINMLTKAASAKSKE